VPNGKRSRVRNWAEFLPAWITLKVLALLPRNLAKSAGRSLAFLAYILDGKLRRTAHQNLSLALPNLSARQRGRIVRGVFRNLGNLLGEFSQFGKLTHETIKDLVTYDGLENYETAASTGRGVLFLTGHFGNWELCAFAHGLFGNKLNFLMRPIDNPLLDGMIDHYRSLSGNRTIDKNNSVKPVLKALAGGEAVGFLIDVNTLPDQGVFCDFFGIPACSTSGLAVFALRTGAPVVPGFLLWDENLGKYKLRFDPEIEVVRTGDFKEEVAINTAKFTRVIEDYARRYPEQWLWIHRRWKTRPEGEPDLYSRTPATTPNRPSIKVGVEA
jgi:Kdo2-lipid IVA lauroyltransferase/acyltransferase